MKRIIKSAIKKNITSYMIYFILPRQLYIIYRLYTILKILGYIR